MEDDGRTRRSTRRLAKNRFRIPSSAHYVGYVEDNETPEMIMKKFEELDKVMTDTHTKDAPDVPPPSGHGLGVEEVVEEEQNDATGFLNEAQLNELFKRTSMFTVKSAMKGGGHLGQRDLDGGEWEQDLVLSEEGEALFSSDDEQMFWGNMGAEEGPTSRRKSVKKSMEGRARSRASYQTLTQTGMGTSLRLQKKPGSMNQEDIVKMAIPDPLPLSWGRTIKPLGIPKRLVESGEEVGSSKHPAICLRFPDLCLVDFSMYYKKYIGVMVNPGWEVTEDESASISRLAKTPIPLLNPHGFIFVWVKKNHLQRVWSLMTRWKYVYVENLTWVMLKPNNQIILEDNLTTRVSHTTLYIFRKDGEGKDIEIRHQRSPDVVFDCARGPYSTRGWVVPDDVYASLETMLPNAQGKFLELWSSPEAARPGWTHIHEGPQEPSRRNG